MKKKSCSITLTFDLDRTDSPVTAKMLNEPHEALLVTRRWYDSKVDRKDWLTGGGVYFRMSGKKIYVGQTDDFYQRFNSHASQKTGLRCWDVAICFKLPNTTKDFREFVEHELSKCFKETDWICETDKTTTKTCDNVSVERIVETIWLLFRAYGYQCHYSGPQQELPLQPPHEGVV